MVNVMVAFRVVSKLDILMGAYVIRMMGVFLDGCS
jgi:hypothetical protein